MDDLTREVSAVQSTLADVESVAETTAANEDVETL